MESDSVALEPVSSTQLKLALSAISAKNKEKILIKAYKMVTKLVGSYSVQPKPGFGIRNRNQGPLSVSV